ncbi:hypothetical protein GS545_25270, partial [Rhodococcus hoagii]|nr:hypothetical protein [Prescottella equi]
MEPLLPVVVVAAGWYAFRRRRVDIFAPLAVCGGVLAFQAAAQYTGMTFGWFRFYILVVPMTVIAAMTLWEPLRSREPVDRCARARRRCRIGTHGGDAGVLDSGDLALDARPASATKVLSRVFARWSGR